MGNRTDQRSRTTAAIRAFYASPREHYSLDEAAEILGADPAAVEQQIISTTGTGKNDPPIGRVPWLEIEFQGMNTFWTEGILKPIIGDFPADHAVTVRFTRETVSLNLPRYQALMIRALGVPCIERLFLTIARELEDDEIAIVEAEIPVLAAINHSGAEYIPAEEANHA